MNCQRCGSPQTRVVPGDDVVDFKGLTLEVQGLQETRCDHCHLSFATPEQELENLRLLREAFAKRRDEVRAEQGLLTASQIEYVLERLHLNKSEASRLFGGGPNSFGKYVSGEVLQSVAMDRLLRMTLAGGPAAVDFLRSLPHEELRENSLKPTGRNGSTAQTAAAFVVKSEESLGLGPLRSPHSR